MAISETKRKRIWENSDHACTYCKRPLKYRTMTVDHIVPQSLFKDAARADADDNLCLACKTCNNAKGDMSVKEFKKWVNSMNSEFMKLESDRRKTIARAEQLSKQIEGRRFMYIRYLRKRTLSNG